ncbi:hypothetical protein [Sphingosinicella sp. CPCC 101087]|uniref:hypothetical protein n=1 Tax=Sphingosinicella sp. CPCC 101087 TaxID=2497754 RepID=UPI00101D39A6|nr:hypothetical protein [Sphingosinicella sp. CPCC 101087]
MNWDGQALFDLLPEVHRTRDAELDHPLRQFLTVLGEQARILEEDAAFLYDNAFVETAADWVLPYIGDLIGYRTIHGIPAAIGRRAEIANTIAYRRRKGTVVMLEQLARDVTGWPAHAKEFFQILLTNQNLNHVRPLNGASPDLRHWEPLERLESAFDSLSHTIDVGRIAIGEGRHNIRNIGLFLWRLRAYPLQRVAAGRHPADPRRFFFNPLAADAPLFNAPVAEPDIVALAGPLNVPEPIGRRRFAQFTADYYPRALSIEADGVALDLADVRGCHLGDAGAGAWAHAPDDVVAIDPVLGRISFPPNRPAPDVVIVSWNHGFSADVGGGPYERAASFAEELAPVRPVSGGTVLQPELDQVQGGGAVEIADSLAYAGSVSVAADADVRVELRAANQQRPLIDLPGELVITGAAGAEVTLNGLLIAGGRIRVPAANNALRRLRIRHSTLVPGHGLGLDGLPTNPGAPSLLIEAENVLVEIEQSILGPIHADRSTQLHIIDSIVDATDSMLPAIAGADGADVGPTLHMIDTTVFGKIHVATMALVSNSILAAALAPADTWTAPVRAERRQIGCVRFSYVPPGSAVPRRHRCQPSHAVAAALRTAREANPMLSAAEADAIVDAVRDRLRPSWTDLRYGRPGYAQLLRAAPVEIRTGADDESEMGVFHKLYQPQREANLRIRMEEYLVAGLEAGAIFAT